MRIAACSGRSLYSKEPKPPSESRILTSPSNPPMMDSIRDSTYDTASRPIFITSSGTLTVALFGKLLATPSHAQQCCGRPSGPNMVFRKTTVRCWRK
eukprot:Gb_16728 [translate_table: standard]